MVVDTTIESGYANAVAIGSGLGRADVTIRCSSPDLFLKNIRTRIHKLRQVVIDMEPAHFVLAPDVILRLND